MTVRDSTQKVDKVNRPQGDDRRAEGEPSGKVSSKNATEFHQRASRGVDDKPKGFTPDAANSPASADDVINAQLKDNSKSDAMKSELEKHAASSKGFEEFVENTFGVKDSSADRSQKSAKVEALRGDINAGDWSWAPEVSSGKADGFDGAFLADENEGKILVDKRLKGDQLAKTVWEEVGHAIDHRLRGGEGDAKGDEGKLFAAKLAGDKVAVGEALATREVGALSDHGEVTDPSSGKSVAAEFAAGDPDGRGLARRVPKVKGQVPVHPTGKVISGHGSFRPANADLGTFKVPEGRTVTFYAEHGAALGNTLGNEIESGRIDLRKVDHWKYEGGDVIPNYVFKPIINGADGAGAETVATGENIKPVGFDNGETLESILKNYGTGDYHVAACSNCVTANGNSAPSGLAEVDPSRTAFEGTVRKYDPATGGSVSAESAEVARGTLEGEISQRLTPSEGQALHELHAANVERLVAGGRASGATSAEIAGVVQAENKAFATEVAEHIGAAVKKAGLAVDRVAPVLDVAAVGLGIYEDIERGDGLPTKTIQASSGVAGAWAGAEAGAAFGGALAGPVGAMLGGIAGGVLGYSGGANAAAWVEKKVGLVAPDHRAPVNSATIPDAARGYTSLATASADEQYAAGQEAKTLAAYLAEQVNAGDDAHGDGTLNDWWNANLAGQPVDKAHRVFSEMQQLNPDFGYWMSATHGRVFTEPFKEFTKWAMGNATGGSGQGNIVNAVKKFSEIRTNGELNLAQQAWFGNMDPSSAEHFYNQATIYNEAAWRTAPGSRGTTDLINSIVNGVSTRGREYFNAKYGAGL